MKQQEDINLFTYNDPFTYLRDKVQWLKKNNRAFSFRYFAKKANFSSPSTFKLILDGKRNMTVDSVEKINKGLQHNLSESEYFLNLVLLHQEKNHEKKKKYFDAIYKIQKRKNIKDIQTDQYEYFSKWYHPVVRELVRCEGFKGDPEWIAKKIFPAISVSQAKKSVQLLLRLGLIEKDPTGESYVLTNRAISTPKDFFSLLGRNFHKEMGKKGMEALDTVAVEQRDITGIVFGIPRDALQELKQRLGEFRKELTSTIGSMEQETDDVYYLNIQLFPVTKKEEQ